MGSIFLFIIIIYALYILPNLDINNQLVNLISIIILFLIGSILGTLGRKLDKKKGSVAKLKLYAHLYKTIKANIVLTVKSFVSINYFSFFSINIT